MTRPARDGQKGMALMAVLWISLFLSVLLAGALATVRIEAKITRTQEQMFKAEQAAQGALNLVMFELTQQTRNRTAAILPATKSIGDFEVEVSSAIDTERTDINLASESAIAAALQDGGLGLDEAMKLAARIADWRDRDDLTRPNGAEPDNAGNRNFLSLYEVYRAVEDHSDLPVCLTDIFTVAGAAFKDEAGIRNGSEMSASPGQRLILQASLAGGGVSQRFANIYLATGRMAEPFVTVSEPPRASGTELCQAESNLEPVVERVIHKSLEVVLI